MKLFDLMVTKFTTQQRKYYDFVFFSHHTQVKMSTPPTSAEKDNPTDVSHEKADNDDDTPTKDTSIVSKSPEFLYRISKFIKVLTDGSTRTIVTKTPIGPPVPKFPSDELVTCSFPKPHNEAITDGILLNMPTKKRHDDNNSSTPIKKKTKISAKSFPKETFEPDKLVEITNDILSEKFNEKTILRKLQYINIADTRKMTSELVCVLFSRSTEVHCGMGSTYTPCCYGLCEDCDIDYCHEYLFGDYCIDATKRYYCDDRHTACLKQAYVVFESHYNRRLDVYSFNKKKKIRKDTVRPIPRCMQDSALKHVLEWCKYHMERNEYWCHMNNYMLITVDNSDPGRNLEYGHYDYK